MRKAPLLQSPKRQEPLYIRMEKEYERNVVLPEIAKEKRILAERQQSYRSPAQDSLRLQARQQALLDRYNDGASHHGSEEAPPSHRSASEQAASPRYYKSKWYKASAKELKENSPHKYSKPHRRPPPDRYVYPYFSVFLEPRSYCRACLVPQP